MPECFRVRSKTKSSETAKAERKPSERWENCGSRPLLMSVYMEGEHEETRVGSTRTHVCFSDLLPARPFVGSHWFPGQERRCYHGGNITHRNQISFGVTTCQNLRVFSCHNVQTLWTTHTILQSWGRLEQIRAGTTDTNPENKEQTPTQHGGWSLLMESHAASMDGHVSQHMHAATPASWVSPSSCF